MTDLQRLGIAGGIALALAVAFVLPLIALGGQAGMAFALYFVFLGLLAVGGTAVIVRNRQHHAYATAPAAEREVPAQPVSV